MSAGRVAQPLLLLALGGACAPAPEGPPDLLLVSVDGLRADRVWPLRPADRPSPTPNIDRLAQSGLVVLDHQAGGNESLFSHAVMLTGQPVSALAAPDYTSFTLPAAAMSLAEVLALYGYTAGAFVAGGHVKGAYGFDQGFAVYSDAADFGSLFHTLPAALDWLGAGPPGPRFTFLHGYDAHRPYLHTGPVYHALGAEYAGPVDGWTERADTERIVNGAHHPAFVPDHIAHAEGERLLDPGSYARLRAHAEGCSGHPLSPEDVRHLADHYDSGALSADLQVGRLVAALQASGRWERTLLVITSDHGEDLGEHGLYNHRSALADSTTRVPLIFAGGALAAGLRGRSLAGVSGAIDLVPTMLGAAGAAPPAELRGLDLLAAAEAGPSLPLERVVVQEGVLPMIAAVSGTHRLVMSGVPLDSPLLPLALEAAPAAGPWLRLSDRRTDPGDQLNVAEADPAALEALRGALLLWMEERRPSEARGTQPQDPALQAILRARGYW